MMQKYGMPEILKLVKDGEANRAQKVKAERYQTLVEQRKLYLQDLIKFDAVLRGQVMTGEETVNGLARKIYGVPETVFTIMWYLRVKRIQRARLRQMTHGSFKPATFRSWRRKLY